MAIIGSAPGLEVTVRVNEETATEYDNTHEGEMQGSKTVTKYIESIDDAKFSVFVEAGKRYNWGYKKHLLRFIVTVDGQEICRQVIARRDVERSLEIHGAIVCTGSQRNWAQEELKFSSIKIVNAGVKQVSPDLGIIQVTVTRVTKMGNWHAMPEIEPTENKRPLHVAEKLVKGRSVTHGTTVSKGYKTSRPIGLHPLPILSDFGPIATFRFVYRSREGLQHEMIIPRSPSPLDDRSSVPEPLQGLSQEQLHRLALRGLGHGVKEEVKREFNDELKKESPIKRERSTGRGFDEFMDITNDGFLNRNGKRAKYSSTVDLTNDSDDDFEV